MLNKIISRITHNLALKILALVFASVLWLAVVNIDDPKTTRTFTATVSIENTDYLTDIGKYYEVINNSNTVTFKVTGKRSYLERMGNSDFKAVADLKMMENSNRVPIEITPQRYAGNVTVMSKTYYLELAVEDLMSKPFVISVQTEGKVSEQNAVGETSVSPTLLRVSGPASVVSKIDKVVATVNVEGMTMDITDSVIPTLYDTDGNEIDTTELRFNIQNVMVSVKILNTKEVTINFQTTGTLPQGYEYVGVEYQPQTVLVKGDSSLLNAFNSITVPEEVLDLTDATGNIEREVDISSYLPNRVELVDREQAKISVVVKIEKHETRVFEVPTANINVSNLGSRYDAKFLKDTVKVELEGLSSELNALDASTLTGSVDVRGMAEGEHIVNLKLQLDSKFKLAKKATVQVSILAADNKTDTKEDKKNPNKKSETEDSKTEDTNTDEETGNATTEKSDSSTILED